MIGKPSSSKPKHTNAIRHLPIRGSVPYSKILSPGNYKGDGTSEREQVQVELLTLVYNIIDDLEAGNAAICTLHNWQKVYEDAKEHGWKREKSNARNPTKTG